MIAIFYTSQGMVSVVWSGVGQDHRIYLVTTSLFFSLQQLWQVQTIRVENLVEESYSVWRTVSIKPECMRLILSLKLLANKINVTCRLN